MAIEQILADDQRWAAARLLVTGLGVEIEGDQFAAARIRATHSPDLASARRAPIHLFGLIVPWDASNELCEVVTTLDPARRLDGQDAVACLDVDGISGSEAHLGKEWPSQANALAVAPFLDLRDHRSPQLRIAEV